MKIPLIILALLSIGTGFIPFGEFVSSDGVALHSEFHLTAAILPVSLAVGAILLAAAFYRNVSALPQRIADGARGIYKGAYNKFYIDEIYLFITKKVIFGMFGAVAAWFDKNVVDGFINLTATVSENLSDTLKQMQNGKVKSYAIYFFSGLLGFILLFVFLWT